MRIGFDLRPFLREETGVGVYLKNLLFSLSQIDRENEYFLFSSSLKDRFLPDKIPRLARMKFRDCRYPVRLINTLWYRYNWPPLDIFFKAKLDLTHSATPLVVPTRGKKMVTVHDLFFLDFPDQVDRETRRYFGPRLAKSLREADGVVAVSEFVKNQLSSRFSVPEEKARVIYHGLNQEFSRPVFPEEEETVRRKYAIPSSFLLFVGAQEPRKNLANLIQAFSIVQDKKKNLSLILVGRRGLDSRKLEEEIDRKGLNSKVRLADYISERELAVFYRLASVFVFPSFCEGFGFPLLEAMAAGLPIAASRAPAIPEIAQQAALYFDPHQPEDMAEKILLGLDDQSLRKRLIAEGKRRVILFDWMKSARETLDFYRRLAGHC